MNTFLGRAAPWLLAASLMGGQAALAATSAAAADEGLMFTRSTLHFRLELAPQGSVIFRGELGGGASKSAPGNMMYPADNAAMFLGAIIAHGLINSAIKQGQESQQQKEANKVLEPYAPIIKNYTNRELMTLAQGHAASPENLTLNGDYDLQLVPVFHMTQDQAALILDLPVKVARHDDPAKKRIIALRVVSAPQTATDLPAFWSAEEGKELKNISAGLMAGALDMLAGQLDQPDSADTSQPFKTFRYASGKGIHIERAQLVKDMCNRQVIRDLRGALISVPVTNPATACQAATDTASSAQPAAAL